ncbi:(Fe-S)-binding protein [Sulfurospirillum barnesii]|uniref:Fe-S oxidoreductase n=1 Tax=Sulfurospirillum barnesii (strain ATCC 700032 / DSM 10660 / SES-3) TaxID=760154 RepID=I3XW51_SULBS|nr:(Fe-S)-binding protein [Sulfurospirillum barnesii]AFL68175.1 Fe-S oxidoreductase [Sulfurospirillum barnesii SES-3]
MKIGLFIPCFMNELYPEACMATLKVLEDLGLDVEYPLEQTCCGQAQANTGCAKEAALLAERFFTIFKKYDYIVAPSGSCVSMVRHNYAQFLEGREGFERMRSHTYELVEFLHDVIKPTSLKAKFPYKVGIHNTCHSHRGLGMASMSEQNVPEFSKIKAILSKVEGIAFTELSRKDECCGFGGTFAVSEEAMSAAMGRARLQDHLDAGSEYITGIDLSCLMHMQGLIDREKMPLKTIHIVQILAGDVQ